MNLPLVDRIVRAVLYEGYVLYPYRPSAMKNQQRATFGTIFPKGFSEASQSGDAWTMQTECVVQGSEKTQLSIRVRFLQLVQRNEQSEEVDETNLKGWQEGIERDVVLPLLPLADLLEPQIFRFSFGLEEETDLREVMRCSIEGEIAVLAKWLSNDLPKVTVVISNQTTVAQPEFLSRQEALMHSCVSTHTILGVQDGYFISLLDPPREFQEHVANCINIGTWPVLVGAKGENDCLLSSPIILYDYPEIAPESGGDLFDSTEIDEILSLRILTLTDEEKREIRGGDALARQVLERTEMLSEEQMWKLHGAVRGLRPVRSTNE